jgi:hypothetical protein
MCLDMNADTQHNRKSADTNYAWKTVTLILVGNEPSPLLNYETEKQHTDFHGFGQINTD